MTALPALLLRNWQAVLGLALAAILYFLLAIRTDQRDDARTALAEERRAQILFAERVRSKAEEIARRFAENARRVESDRNQITQEVSREYQTRLSELRARLDRLRAQGRANPGGAGRADLPGLPESAGGPDAAAVDPGFSLERRAVATEQAIRLEELQRWILRQQGVEH